MRRWLCLLSVLVLLPSAAWADEVLLKSGGRLSGRILARSEASVTVDVGPGTITVPMSSVLRIEEGRSPVEEYYERAAALRTDDVTGWLRLGSWASSQGLGTQARRAFEHVLTIDPLHADANVALGRVLVDGRWMSEADSYRARGFVNFEGQWMTPSDREATLSRRDAAQQAEWARIDAERRAADAEARAAEAEARALAAESAAHSAAGVPLWWGGYGYGWGTGYPGYGYTQRTRGFGKGGRTENWPPPSVGWPSSGLGLYPSQPIGPWQGPGSGHTTPRQAGGPRGGSGPPATKPVPNPEPVPAARPPAKPAPRR